ncbi:MAG: diacylglycerol kinase family protein [Myxococcaceae bacterium]
MSYTQRSAFILNANAKSVTDRVVAKLVKLIPSGDLFYSKSMQDSENYYQTILDRGYGFVFSGGGDGTVVNAINTLTRISKKQRDIQLPRIGVLKLGTGNAMAQVVSAQKAFWDVSHIVQGGIIEQKPLQLVECEDGTLTPFAGIGYDGEILNDYVHVKENQGLTSISAYLWAAFSRTLPRHISSKAPIIRIKTYQTAYQMINVDGEDLEIEIPPNTLLYEGPADIASVGSIPWYGFGFTMFPFANRREGFLNLRISTMSLGTMITHLYPGIWKGTFRHAKLNDFLVQDIVIESDQALPYQIGGDASGHRNRLRFKTAKQAVQIAELSKDRLVAPTHSIFGLLPAFSGASN